VSHLTKPTNGLRAGGGWRVAGMRRTLRNGNGPRAGFRDDRRGSRRRRASTGLRPGSNVDPSIGNQRRALFAAAFESATLAVAFMARSLGTSCLLLALLANGCRTFQPQPLDTLSFRERVEGLERDGLRVSVAVLSREETVRAFGLDLYAEKIQPVWLRLQNRSDDAYWLMLNALDPYYFSPREAA